MADRPGDANDRHRRPRPVTIALIGNPNTGKTTLFNALTGYRGRVANYPGVTVEVARGPLRGARSSVELLDLPGTYSLAAAAPDEQMVCDLLAGRLSGHPRPDAVLAIVDACNLPRNLYLVSQLLQLGLPVAIALNMIDIAEARGLRVDATLLAHRLGVPVVPIVATRAQTLPMLVRTLEDLPRRAPPTDIRLDGTPCSAADEVRARYAWASRVLKDVIRRERPPAPGWAERADQLFTHRLWGALVLLTVLAALFQSIFVVAQAPMGWVESAFAWLGQRVVAAMPDSALRSLIVDGIIAGIGGVLVFVPQIMILFGFLAVLEDCGYLARAAFMLDRLMRIVGLSGRAFIPLLSSFACAIPAILGTRTIADRRERTLAIVLAPFMSCSARLPVYVLMIALFVPPVRIGGWLSLQGLVMLAMYLVGATVAVPVAWVLRRTVFRGPPAPFVLELPGYKWPRIGTVLQKMYLAGRKFLVSAGTVILAVNLLVWMLGYFPRPQQTRLQLTAQAAREGWSSAQLEHALAAAWLRDSFLGHMGRAVEPLIAPIGWDWRIGVAIIASFPAREVVVATLGTIFNLGQGPEGGSQELRDAIRSARHPDGRPLFTLPVALSIMVFFALCAQCSSTLVTMGRETGSWTWPLASFLGMTTLAWLGAWATAALARAAGL